LLIPTGKDPQLSLWEFAGDFHNFLIMYDLDTIKKLHSEETEAKLKKNASKKKTSQKRKNKTT